MPDILIRGLDEETIARIDRRAQRQGLSRAEYLRRQVTSDAEQQERRVTIEDLRRVAEDNKDLLDEDVMRRAWS